MYVCIEVNGVFSVDLRERWGCFCEGGLGGFGMFWWMLRSLVEVFGVGCWGGGMGSEVGDWFGGG